MEGYWFTLKSHYNFLLEWLGRAPFPPCSPTLTSLHQGGGLLGLGRRVTLELQLPSRGKGCRGGRTSQVHTPWGTVCFPEDPIPESTGVFKPESDSLSPSGGQGKSVHPGGHSSKPQGHLKMASCIWCSKAARGCQQMGVPVWVPRSPTMCRGSAGLLGCDAVLGPVAEEATGAHSAPPASNLAGRPAGQRVGGFPAHQLPLLPPACLQAQLPPATATPTCLQARLLPLPASRPCHLQQPPPPASRPCHCFHPLPYPPPLARPWWGT